MNELPRLFGTLSTDEFALGESLFECKKWYQKPKLFVM